jgi:hypothetical protein
LQNSSASTKESENCSKVKTYFGQPSYKRNESFPLTAHYHNNWHERVSFEVCDAAKMPDKYKDSYGNDITHIYSYNKVMSTEDRKNISKILNKTNFRIMAWYFGPRESAQSGLKRVKLAHKMPMQSTGKEKFTVYIFFKTEKYDPANPWSDSESDAESEYSSSDSEDEALSSGNSGQKKGELKIEIPKASLLKKGRK